MLWNFRFDRSQTERVLQRITDDGILSQGWGGGPEGGLRIDGEDFIPKCKGFYELASTRIPSNLTWMRDFEDGDLLVVPHLPSDGKASVFTVDGDFPDCYVYKADDRWHINHGIKVREPRGLDGGISIHNHQLAAWHGRLSALRLPVIKQPDLEATFRKLLHDLVEDPKTALAASPVDEFLAVAVDQAVGAMRARLSDIAPAGGGISFESVCEHLLALWGYQIEGRRQYDRKGGDVDLRCVRQRTDLSPFEVGETVLLVQVKKHAGTTDEKAVQQLMRMMADEPVADGCVMSLGEKFSTRAVELAQQQGIMLMDGGTICRLLLGRLSGATGQ